MNLETMVKIQLPSMNPGIVSREIEDFITDTVTKTGASGAVIGLSGGVDSATVAALAQQAFDRYNVSHDKHLELVGYVLPSKTNDPADTSDGISVAKRLGIRYETHSLEPLLEAYRQTNPEAFNQFDKGNMTSRIRSVVLNTKASTEHKTLLGTGNKDEDFGIGYYTLFGDGAVHCSPIGGLSKRLVRQLARHLGFSDLAYREPTAGLEPGQTDFTDLGYSYDFVEMVTEGLQQGICATDLPSHEQIAALYAKDAIRYTEITGKTKFAGATDAVQDLLRRHHIAAAKASIIHPPTPQVTLEYA